jgi:hypothetical protein
VVALDIRHLAMEVLAAVAVPEPVVALVAVADTLGAVAGGGITEIHH